MRRRGTWARAAAALALASALPLAAAGEETKVIQGMYLSVTGAEDQGNGSSPFARYPVPRDWSFGASSFSSYSLRFQARELSGQVAASAQGSAQDAFALSIDQAWVKATFGEGWGAFFGRRELNWKDGGYWNPSDVVNGSLAWSVAGEAVGGAAPGKDSVELIGLLPFMDFNIDLSAATLLSSGIDDPGQLPLYLAAGSILYPLELRAKLALQDGRQALVGASAKLSLSSGNLYADGLWLRDHPIAAAFDPFAAPRGDWFRYCAGADWTFDASASKLASALSLRLEYLRQDDGLSKGQMTGYFAALAAMPLTKAAEIGAYGTTAAAWGGRFFSFGKDYLFANLSLAEIAQLHLGLSASCLLNLDDLSFVLRETLSWSPKSLFAIGLTASNYLGDPGSEAGMLPIKAEYSLCLSRSF